MFACLCIFCVRNCKDKSTVLLLYNKLRNRNKTKSDTEEMTEQLKYSWNNVYCEDLLLPLVI